MSTYLDAIVAAHRQRAAQDRRPFDELLARAETGLPTRSLRQAISASGLSVIAEFKRRSPSKGLLNGSMDIATMAGEYERGGAAAMSVLTDEEFFGGTLDDLKCARASVSLPILRKDFVVDARDVCDARLNGADAVLLIVAALSDEELSLFAQIAASLHLAVLVEVHDELELKRAGELPSPIIGVNQRDLHTFEVDTGRALRLLEVIPDGVLAVAESGISTSSEARRLAQAGFDAVLVGETFVRSEHPRDLVAEMAGLPVGVRQAGAES